MKRTDIRAGVVYAYQRSRGYGAPEPIVFLAAPSDGKLYSTGSTWRKTDGPVFSRAPANVTKPGRSGSTWDSRRTGYPVVVLTVGVRGAETDPAGLLKLKLEDFEKAASGQSTGIKGAYFDVLTTLGQVTGLYDEMVAEHEGQRDAERAEAERQRTQAEAARSRADAITDALSTFDVDAEAVSKDRQNWSHICISAADAEKLIALLRNREA